MGMGKMGRMGRMARLVVVESMIWWLCWRIVVGVSGLLDVGVFGGR